MVWAGRVKFIFWIVPGTGKNSIKTKPLLGWSFRCGLPVAGEAVLCRDPERERERECVCERERECVCVCERERECV